jgi:protein phosphatase
MGTTMTAAIIVEDRLHVGHVGDSRLYHMGSGQLHQVTQDHSLVGELVRMGELTSDQAMTHPQRNIVTRALGTEWDVVIDCFSLELSVGDSLLLCTDGLTSMIRYQELADRLAVPSASEHIASSLINEANARGGYDNISVIVCQVGPGEVGGGAA